MPDLIRKLAKQDRKLARSIENRRKRRDSPRVINVDRMLKQDRKELLAA